MALKRRAEQRLRKLLRSSASRVEPVALEHLEALPAGWAGAVAGMISQVEEVLSGEERLAFRWTEIAEHEGRLEVAWTGDSDSTVLIEQIVEDTAEQLSHACIDCGLPALSRSEAGKPRCLLHAGLGTALAEWRTAAADVARGMRQLLGRFSSMEARTKAAAAALPALMAEAQTYLRKPDGDAAVIIKRIREAMQRLEREAKRSVGVSIVNGK